MRAVFAVYDSVVAEVESQFDDILHVCVLDCARFRVVGFAGFQVLGAKRWVSMQLSGHDVEILRRVGRESLLHSASLQKVGPRQRVRAVNPTQVL
jgi:hypothetical protein